MRKLFLAVLLILSLVSCGQITESNKRTAYSGFQLGSGVSEINERIWKLAKTGIVTPLGKHDYYWRNYLDQKLYFYAPIFFFPAGDSICSEMRLMFFDKLENGVYDLNNAKEGVVSMNLACYDGNRIESGKLKIRVIEALTNEFGNYTTVDTLTWDDDQLEMTKWKNKNGIDITVRYRYLKDKWAPFVSNSSLTVSYTYTDEMRKKIMRKSATF